MLIYRRLFSSLRGAKLSKALYNTYTHEKAMYEQEEGISTFLRRSEFELEQHGAHVKLHRLASGYQVQVEFNAQTLQENSSESVPFDVRVTREQDSLLFTCVRAEETVQVLNLQHSSQEYGGPVFSTLDAQLKELFDEMLRSLGVTLDLALFVEAFAVDTEQRLFLKWLKDARSLVRPSQDAA